MPAKSTVDNNNWLYALLLLIAAINFTGLFTPVMGPDGNLYALIAKTMVQRSDYVNLYYHGADWLDKPHFPFWITALSFRLLGFTTLAYKLPGILFMLMGAWYTYLFAERLYNKEVALWSVLVLLTSQHIILSNNDVRAEPYLTGLIIAAVYHFYRAHQSQSWWQLLYGSFFAACAIMTKGMFAIIPIGGAVFGHFVITRQWKALFNRRWLIAVILTLLFILPEIWCLYCQFDLHPEKIVFDHQGVSGIRFFFWDSQFGRFFNTGPIKGSGDPAFFIHTTLWAFLPWSLLLFAAVFQLIKKGMKNIQAGEWYCISGALLTFLLFSASKFQLPHYLNIVFPFFAIITAQYLYRLSSPKTISAVRITQIVVIILMLIVVSVLQYFFKAEKFSMVIIVLMLLCLAALVFFPAGDSYPVVQKVIFKTVLASVTVNIYLNLAFYPSLIQYQSGSEAAFWINNHNPGHLSVAEPVGENASSFEFYNNGPVKLIDLSDKNTTPAKPFILYAQADAIKAFSAKGYHISELARFNNYTITRLKPAFINSKTRLKQLVPAVVVVVN